MIVFVSVFFECVAAIAQIFLLCAVGALMERIGILNHAGRKTVSQLSYHVFIPALSFVRLAGAEGAVKKLWFLLFNMGAAISVGTLVGTWTASLVFPRRRRRRSGREGSPQREESLRKVVAACTAYGNMANLPLVLVSALCSGESARAVLFSSPGPSRSPSPSSPLPPGVVVPSRAQCSATAEEYVMAPIAVASVMQFMLAEAILRGKGRRKGREETTTRPPPARGAARAAAAGGGGTTTSAAAPPPPRGSSSSAELVPLRTRVQEEEEEEEGGGGEEEEDEEGAEKKQRATGAVSRPLPPLSSPFGANGSSKGKGPAPSPTSLPPPPLPPRFHAAETRGDCVSIDMKPPPGEGEEEGAAAAAAAGEAEGRGNGRLLSRSPGSKHFKAVADGLEAEEEEGICPAETSWAQPTTTRARCTIAEGGERGERAPSASSSHLRRALSIATEAAAAAANPPAVAALLGLAVGSVPALRSLFFSSSGGGGGGGGFAVLGPLSTVFETLGGAMIPCLMVVLGAELSAKPEEAEEEGASAAAGATGEGRDREGEESRSSPSSSSPLPAAAVAAALAARLVLMPCLGACFLFFCSRGGLLSPGKTSPPEPLFRLVALLAWGTPAAIMLSTLCSRLGSGPSSSSRGDGAGRAVSGSSSGGGGSGRDESSSSSSSALAKPMAVLLAWNYGAAALTLPLLASAAMAAMT